jgi:molybdopterin-guanine dinucleotide biosynthesis protein A
MSRPVGNEADKITAILLCGGRSRRFGRDKAMASLRGRSLLDHVIEVCGVHADQVVLACGREPRYASTGLALAIDAPANDGPLAGIAAGLEIANHPSILIVAVDLGGLSPAAIEGVKQAWDKEPSVDLILPRTERGVEPLFCMGRREPLRTAVARLSATSDPAPRRLPEFLSSQFIDVSSAPHDPLRRAITNINTPEDLAALAE